MSRTLDEIINDSDHYQSFHKFLSMRNQQETLDFLVDIKEDLPKPVIINKYLNIRSKTALNLSGEFKKNIDIKRLSTEIKIQLSMESLPAYLQSEYFRQIEEKKVVKKEIETLHVRCWDPVHINLWFEFNDLVSEKTSFDIFCFKYGFHPLKISGVHLEIYITDLVKSGKPADMPLGYFKRFTKLYQRISR